jgi:hypothetical protein
MTRKILVLSTYPIKNPKHGGQKRLHAITEAYKAAFEDVRHCAVFFKGFYSDYDKDDIPLSRDSEHLVTQSPLTGDIIGGNAIYEDPIVKAKFTKLIQEFSPEIIHIEQPFMYLGLKPLMNEMNFHPAGAPKSAVNEAEELINDLEESLSKECDLVVACTVEDMKAHAKLGATELVLAPNGIARSETDRSSLSKWQTRFMKDDVSRTVLFVGSAHPPNWTGFLDMVGKGLGFIPYDTRIVAAGSICDYFEREINSDNQTLEDATFWLRAFSAGRLSEPSLGALIQLSDIIILPITEGGGSNLKTAEAILADKKVVTTSHALRSFEWFEKFPNVWIADEPDIFRDSIVKALDTPKVTRTADQTKQAAAVEWSNCLADMIKRVQKL